MTRVLVVEDEDIWRESLVDNLKREGFEVIEANDGKQAIDLFNEVGADFVLLDLMLPGVSGNEVCQTIRKVSQVPIIMLTAKDTEIDRVVGLEIGADDYVSKVGERGAYSFRELLARMKAVMRRQIEPANLEDTVIEAGPVRMDVDRHQVSVRGQNVTMPLKEFEVLELLLRNRNRVLTRGQIIDRVWGSNYFGDTKTLDVHIKRIRSKIEDDPTNAVFLLTVRGRGYKFEV